MDLQILEPQTVIKRLHPVAWVPLAKDLPKKLKRYFVEQPFLVLSVFKKKLRSCNIFRRTCAARAGGKAKCGRPIYNH